MLIRPHSLVCYLASGMIGTHLLFWGQRLKGTIPQEFFYHERVRTHVTISEWRNFSRPSAFSVHSPAVEWCHSGSHLRLTPFVPLCLWRFHTHLLILRYSHSKSYFFSTSSWLEPMKSQGLYHSLFTAPIIGMRMEQLYNWLLFWNALGPE